MSESRKVSSAKGFIPYLVTLWPSEMRWLGTFPCEQQRMNGMRSGTCRSPVRSEGRARENWCVSCQARELEDL